MKGHIIKFRLLAATVAFVAIGPAFDYFTTLRAVLGDSAWLGLATEAYLFAAGLTWCCALR